MVSDAKSKLRTDTFVTLSRVSVQVRRLHFYLFCDRVVVENNIRTRLNRLSCALIGWNSGLYYGVGDRWWWWCCWIQIIIEVCLCFLSICFQVKRDNWVDFIALIVVIWKIETENSLILLLQNHIFSLSSLRVLYREWVHGARLVQVQDTTQKGRVSDEPSFYTGALAKHAGLIHYGLCPIN